MASATHQIILRFMDKGRHFSGKSQLDRDKDADSQEAALYHAQMSWMIAWLSHDILKDLDEKINQSIENDHSRSHLDDPCMVTWDDKDLV